MLAGDGLSVVEAALGLDRVEACMPPKVPAPKPGPCPGTKRGAKKAATAVKKAVAPKKRAGKKKVEPLTDAEFAAHAARVERQLRENPSWGITAGETFADKDRIQREIVDDVYARFAGVPNDGKAIFSAGMSGAGKTTALRQLANADDYVMVSADDFKEEMARRGLIPEVGDLSPMERSTLVHDESIRMSELLADRAIRDRKNLIWDTTMNDSGLAEWRIDRLRDNGFDDISGMLVTVPAAVAAQRVTQRYRDGLEAWRQGEGLGGRFIPGHVIRGLNPAQNERAFESVKPLLSDWTVFDSSGAGAPRVTSRRGEG